MKMPALLAICFAAISGQAAAVDLTFRNNSLKSIPLEIPGVMNPNLSPLSNSGVDLEKGQKIYFKYQGKRTLLLEITNQKDGDIILIDEVIKARIAELGN